MNSHEMLIAKGARSGGSRSSGSKSSSSSKSTSTSKTNTSTSKSTTSVPSKPKTQSKPSSQTKTITQETPKTSSGKTYSRTGHTVDEQYQPRFSGGYAAPAGSVVYYRDSSALDWLPFYLIMNSNNQHREAVVVQPDGKEQIVKEEGTDGMYIFNWFITIAFIVAIIAGIVWLVNKRTSEY